MLANPHEAQAAGGAPGQRRAVAVCFVVLAVFAAATIGCMLAPPVFPLDLPQGERLIVWPRGWAHRLRCLLVAGSALAAVLALWGVRRTLAAAGSSDERRARRLERLYPLAGCPLLWIVFLLADVLPLPAVSNLIFFGSVYLGASLLHRLTGTGAPAAGRKADARRDVWVILAVACAAYWMIGCYLSLVAGRHAGDEGQYLIITQSLWEDGDLDLRNNLLQESRTQDPDRMDLIRMHIAPDSRGGHWYSWHPYGLPLLMAPLWPAGMVPQQLLLALISALGCVGMYVVSRRLGASRRAASVVLFLFAGSLFWTIYSCRFLPEVLGATLMIWVFWAVTAQRETPWRSAAVAAACCVCLPFVHFRFVPLSLMGFGWYGLFGLCSAHPLRFRLRWLAVFALCVLAGQSAFWMLQFRMYAGGSGHPVAPMLLAYPAGMWAALADARGLVTVLPLFLWMAGAHLAWAAVRPAEWPRVLAVFTTFAACALTSCTHDVYYGGACLPGRFVLAVTALLVPGSALMFDRAGQTGRTWCLFLGAVSIGVLLITLVRLPEVGRNFASPVRTLTDVPLLRGLLHPFTVMYRGAPWSLGLVAMNLFVVAGILASALAILRPTPGIGTSAALALVAVAALAAHRLCPAPGLTPNHAGRVASHLAAVNLERARVRRVPGMRPLDIWRVSRLAFPDVRESENRPALTTRDLGIRSQGMLFSQPRLEINDWAGRGYRWATLTRPVRPSPGRRLIHLAGTLEGDAQLHLAIREGSRSVYEGRVPAAGAQVNWNIGVPLDGRRGDLYILIRLDGGEGTFRLTDLSWTPYSRRLLEEARLRLPPNSTEAEQASTP